MCTHGLSVPETDPLSSALGENVMDLLSRSGSTFLTAMNVSKFHYAFQYKSIYEYTTLNMVAKHYRYFNIQNV